jgi:hypothetical protein
MMLTNIDLLRSTMATLEKTIRETSERWVSGVAFQHGKDSREYETVGGINLESCSPAIHSGT